MQPSTAETPQYAKAGSAYETPTAKSINPRGLYYNPGNDTYIGTTHEIQGDALIRQGFQLVHDGPVEAAKYTDGDGNVVTPQVYQLSDKEIRTYFDKGELKKVEKPAKKKAATKTLATPQDEFVTSEEDEEDGEADA